MRCVPEKDTARIKVLVDGKEQYFGGEGAKEGRVRLSDSDRLHRLILLPIPGRTHKTLEVEDGKCRAFCLYIWLVPWSFPEV